MIRSLLVHWTVGITPLNLSAFKGHKVCPIMKPLSNLYKLELQFEMNCYANLLFFPLHYYFLPIQTVISSPWTMNPTPIALPPFLINRLFIFVYLLFKFLYL